MYPAFAAALLDETGIDIELETAGTLYLAFTSHDAQELQKRYEWQTKAGLPIEKLSAQAVTELEPAINEEVRAALKFPLDTQVENRRLISALTLANERLGVRMETGTAVTSLKIEHDRFSGFETSRGFISADAVVIAGGAWSSLWEPETKPCRSCASNRFAGRCFVFSRIFRWRDTLFTVREAMSCRGEMDVCWPAQLQNMRVLRSKSPRPACSRSWRRRWKFRPELRPCR